MHVFKVRKIILVEILVALFPLIVKWLESFCVVSRAAVVGDGLVDASELIL